MRIIALMNQKGGVGKTTTTVNLGAALAEAGKRVLLIDLDPQAHLTINYGVEPSAKMVSLYDVLIEERSLLEAIHRAGENIALVPSSIHLAAAEVELVSVLGREQLLKKRLESAQPDFDYVLLDSPPSLGLLTLNALSVANEVVIPMQPHFLALQGVGKLLETVQLVSKRMNPGLKVAGIVLTMWDSQTKLSAEVVNDLNHFIEAAKGKPLPWAGARIFKSKIRRNIKLAESPSYGQTILTYDSASNGAADYRNLAREILGMEGAAVDCRLPIADCGLEEKAAAVPAAMPASVVVPAAIGKPVDCRLPIADCELEEKTGPLEVSAAVASPTASAPAPAGAQASISHPQSAVGHSQSAIRSSQSAIHNPQSATRTPPSPKPKMATLVTPAQAARLKAATIVPVKPSAAIAANNRQEPATSN